MTAWVTRVAEVRLGVALQLLQDAGGDLLRGVGLAVDVDRPVGAHVALHRPDRAVGVGDRLALGDLADEDLAGLRERDDRRRGAAALGVGDDGGLARLEDRDDGVGGAEVDTDGLGHRAILLMERSRPEWVRRESNLSRRRLIFPGRPRIRAARAQIPTRGVNLRRPWLAAMPSSTTSQQVPLFCACSRKELSWSPAGPRTCASRPARCSSPRARPATSSS